jgi:hypothetical protein
MARSLENMLNSDRKLWNLEFPVKPLDAMRLLNPGELPPAPCVRNFTGSKVIGCFRQGGDREVPRRGGLRFTALLLH